jgi:CRISPR-associated protein Csc2
MRANIPEPLHEVEDYVYDEVPTAATGRMAHIGVLRETSSYNIFTTEGSELNLASTDLTTAGDEKMQRIVMFKRKQVAAERRKGKEFLRGLYKNHSESITGEDEEAFGKFNDDEDLCRLHDNLCGLCIDCKLYGFANAKPDRVEGSRTSRVLTDSAFSVRGLQDGRRQDITFNAQSEENERDGQSHALNSTAHARPETFFPSIVTLRDFTYRELYWLIHLIQSTTRYGAETSRTGYVDNDVVSIWFDTKETMSNLELSQRTRENLGEDFDDLTTDDVQGAMLEAIPDSEVDVGSLKQDIEKELSDDSAQIDFLQKLHGSQTG